MEYVAVFALLVIIILGTIVLCAKQPKAKPADPVRIVRTYPNGKFAAMLDGYKLVRLTSTGEVIHLRHAFPVPNYVWLFDTFNEAMDLHRQHMAGDQHSDQRVRLTE